MMMMESVFFSMKVILLLLFLLVTETHLDPTVPISLCIFDFNAIVV